MKKKLVFPKFSLAAFIAGILLLGGYFVIDALEKLNIHLYFGGINTQEIFFIMLCVGVTAVISAIAWMLFKNIKRKWISILISAALAGLACWYLAIFSWGIMETKYFEFTSDDGKHNIVVEENSWLHYGGGQIYEKTSTFTMEEVGGYMTDDGYRPFSRNDYYFVWNENNFEIHLLSGQFFRCYGPLEYVK